MIGDLNYPAGDSLAAGIWVPIYFSPNFDSPERLVAGVAAFVDGKWHVSRAAALDRLNCLYGREGELAKAAIAIGLDALEEQLIGERSSNVDLQFDVSGLSVGERAPAEARNARDLALRRLRAISSLHSVEREMGAPEPAMQVASSNVRLERDISRDRLPVLVMESMIARTPAIRSAFNPHVLKLQVDEGARRLTHRAYVAFTGQKVVANFATLKAGRQKTSVDVSKRLMWDLEQHREGDKGQALLPDRNHEMILYHPAQDDPTITPRQFDNIIEVVETLQQEGRNREIQVSSYESVPRIADHILAEEGYA